MILFCLFVLGLTKQNQTQPNQTKLNQTKLNYFIPKLTRQNSTNNQAKPFYSETKRNMTRTK